MRILTHAYTTADSFPTHFWLLWAEIINDCSYFDKKSSLVAFKWYQHCPAVVYSARERETLEDSHFNLYWSSNSGLKGHLRLITFYLIIFPRSEILVLQAKFLGDLHLYINLFLTCGEPVVHF